MRMPPEDDWLMHGHIYIAVHHGHIYAWPSTESLLAPLVITAAVTHIHQITFTFKCGK